MAWVTPKTDWSRTDYINIGDYNRIKNNLLELRDMAGKLYPEFAVNVDPDKTNYGGWPYPADINRLEENLETIRSHTYPFATGAKRTYYSNAPTIDWQELNRLESAALLIYNSLRGQAAGRRKLSFKLGGQRF